ncbi:hypothetical protein DET0385 [Dehalococcoides mccartyi 195]|uniref:Uncharacterized protein n=1 Tax=Dehalococcoides mccartyi (strain ATCC BAA-2266 / KCTC 15142 / 195) TaxID=243164 RepID=Q3Z9G9_DEHM1|nr:hypothetical protein DET0385 [Dehalococcoides mccartyi 195]
MHKAKKYIEMGIVSGPKYHGSQGGVLSPFYYTVFRDLVFFLASLAFRLILLQ